MDHAINSLQPFLDIEITYLVEEMQSGKYQKLSDCPSYPAAKALADAMLPMRRYLGWEPLRLRQEVSWRLPASVR